MNTSQQFFQYFGDVSKGVSKYINLESLLVGLPYEVKRFRFFDGKFGRCLVVDLLDGFGVILPKRISDTVKTQQELDWLNSKQYSMTFCGRNTALKNMAIIEFNEIKSLEEKPVQQDQEVQVSNYLEQMSDIDAVLSQIETAVEEKAASDASKAPKVTIKVKKERK